MINFFVNNWYWLLAVIIVFALMESATIKAMSQAVVENPVIGFLSVVLHFPIKGMVLVLAIITGLLTVLFVVLAANWALSQFVHMGVSHLQSMPHFWAGFPTPSPTPFQPNP